MVLLTTLERRTWRGYHTSLVIWLSDHHYAGIFAHDGMYGTVSGPGDILVMIQRIFGIYSWIFVYVPYTVVTLVIWAVISLKARRVVTCVTQWQRWKMVFAMLVLPALGFVFELSRLPKMILFTGPLNGFHPLTPITMSFFQFVTPLIFWVLVGEWEASRTLKATGEKAPKSLTNSPKSRR